VGDGGAGDGEDTSGGGMPLFLGDVTGEREVIGGGGTWASGGGAGALTDGVAVFTTGGVVGVGRGRLTELPPVRGAGGCATAIGAVETAGCVASFGGTPPFSGATATGAITGAAAGLITAAGAGVAPSNESRG
jgi:hypothetical protein